MKWLVLFNTNDTFSFWARTVSFMNKLSSDAADTIERIKETFTQSNGRVSWTGLNINLLLEKVAKIIKNGHVYFDRTKHCIVSPTNPTVLINDHTICCYKFITYIHMLIFISQQYDSLWKRSFFFLSSTLCHYSPVTLISTHAFQDSLKQWCTVSVGTL